MFLGDWREDLKAILGLCLVLLNSYWYHLVGCLGQPWRFFRIQGSFSSTHAVTHIPERPLWETRYRSALLGGGGGHEPQTLIHICRIRSRSAAVAQTKEDKKLSSCAVWLCILVLGVARSHLCKYREALAPRGS